MNNLIRHACISLLTRTCRVWPSKFYLDSLCKLRLGYKVNWENPKTYNEKLQWLKLYYHNPLLTKLVDKYQVKEHVSHIIGTQYIIPTIGVWNSFDEIDFSRLPNQFVLKCTHDSGGLVICKDKNCLDIKTARKKITKSLNYNFYYLGREWPYKNVARKIIAEKYMVDESGTELKDYKFFCFDGEPKMLFIATDRPIDTKFNFYDLNFNLLPFTNGHPNSTNPIEKPKNYDQMVEIARKLSKGLPHVRIDLYNVDGQIYFGEMTFFHWGGTIPFKPQEWDHIIGDWLTLPKPIL